MSVPGEAIKGSRCEWPKEPYMCQPCPCYLCGSDFPCKEDLVYHWRTQHLDLPASQRDGLSDYRVEEEIRTRIFHDEAFDGPFEVRGQEMRRMVGTHATNQTHGAPGSGCVNDASQSVPLVARCRGGAQSVHGTSG